MSGSATFSEAIAATTVARARQTTARERFFEDGYASVTLRSIAAAAGVDVALVSYWFGSKRALFAAAMDLTVSPADALDAALAGDDAGIAERVIGTLVSVWDDAASGAPLRAAATAAASDPIVGGLVAEAVERELIDGVAARLSGPDARDRAAAFCTGTAGIIFLRYILRVEPLATMPADRLVRLLAPALQTALALPDAEPADQDARA
jgi:AcrR family transcriptional regulator